MADAFKKHGQVFTVPLFHKRVTFLIGPEVAPHFYKARRAPAGRPRSAGTAVELLTASPPRAAASLTLRVRRVRTCR